MMFGYRENFCRFMRTKCCGNTMRFFCFGVIITFFSCNSTHSDSRAFQFYSDTTSIHGISAHQWHQKFTNAINLPDITKGVDSFELRLWCDLVITDLKTVTILRYTDSSWKLTETRYWVNTPNEWAKQPELIIDSLTTKRVIPKLPFFQAIDSIESYRLDTAITQRKIPNFEDRTADGMSYTIEIATKNSYRVIYYNNPFSYSDPNDTQITKFLKFMGKNLNAFVISK
jgi:hypothetical protein